MSRDKWEMARLEAYLWWCGDYNCDCSQPVIDRVTPNRQAGYPWIHREKVWQGSFRTGGEDMDMLRAELVAAAVEYHIKLDKDSHGWLEERGPHDTER